MTRSRVFQILNDYGARFTVLGKIKSIKTLALVYNFCYRYFYSNIYIAWLQWRFTFEVCDDGNAPDITLHSTIVENKLYGPRKRKSGIIVHVYFADGRTKRSETRPIRPWERLIFDRNISVFNEGCVLMASKLQRRKRLSSRWENHRPTSYVGLRAKRIALFDE